ncbi:accessory gene regulator B family protein [Cohnella suwonensis]|uniref:Accessory gene regulator B family protein n=1 Tax=Cohnella suwonensis TaxID=696072 RepID=A0ABW0LXD2_9BACL
MIEAISERVSGYLYRQNEQKDVSREVMKFALIGILTNGLIILLTLLIGIFDGKFQETCLSLASIVAIRFLAGGHHLSPPILCVAISTGAITLVPFIPESQTLTNLFTAFSLVLIWIYAPADLEKNTRISKPMLRWMKYSAFVLAASNLILQSHIIATAFFIASLTLISIKGVNRHE